MIERGLSLSQHLKDMISSSHGDVTVRLADRVAALVNLILQSRIPADIFPLLYGACLTVLRKSGGGIRPIAVGDTVRRRACKIISKGLMASIGDLFRPAKQFGYGTPGGAKAVVHATRSFLSNSGPANALLKLDFCNAFNTIYRDKMLHGVKERLPEYYGFYIADVSKSIQNLSRGIFTRFSFLEKSRIR